MSEILGIGMDLCGISRMEALMEKPSYLSRIFTAQEQDYAASRGKAAGASYAAMWAAKEACGKALGCGIVFPMTEVEVLHDTRGKPSLRLSGKALQLAGDGSFFLSLTHEGDMAGAFCIYTK